MGTGYSYTCTNCHFSTNYYFGMGFLLHEYELSESFNYDLLFLHPKTIKKISDIGNQNPGSLLKTEYKIFKCKRCNNIVNEFDITVELNDKLLYKRRIRCNHCKSTLLKPSRLFKTKPILCPYCHNKTLIFDDILMWD